MKIAGYIFIVLGVLAFVLSIVGLSTVDDPDAIERLGSILRGSFINFILGGVLIHCANSREKREKNKNEE